MAKIHINFILLFLLIKSYFMDLLVEESLLTPNYECLNGNNPSNMSRKDILKEFAKGPCSPLMIVPALLSTKLVVEIDCPTLMTENNHLFTLCGWNSCEKGFYEFWKSVPLNEYHLWIPTITGPLSIFQFSESKNLCWANFVKLSIDTTKPITESVIERKGFKVKVFGQSSGTEKQSECGDGANKDLLSYEWIEIRKTRYLKYLYAKLKGMGYIAGLTYQNLPFDFRLSYRANQVNKLFLSNLKRLNKITGKKVILLGHSLGNLNIYHQLINMNRDIKQKLVKSWISVASANGGALQDFNIIVAGDDEFMYLKNMVGIHFHAEIVAFNNMISAYELLPIDYFTYHDKQPWLKAVKKRIDYENGLRSYEDSGFDFLPKVEDKCSPDNFVDYPTDCRMGLFDYREKPIVKILDDEYKVNEIDKMLGKYNMTEHTFEIYQHTRDEQMAKLINPEVPIVSINLRTGSTIEEYVYDKDIREYLHTHSYPKAKMKKGYGDGVLSSTTQLIGPLKWAYEFNNKIPYAHPIKLIDVCSVYNVKYDIYDKKDTDKAFEFNKNEFVGVECECMKQKNTENCNHPNVMIDNYVQTLVLNTLISNDRSYSDIYHSFIDSLDDKYLIDITTTCPQLDHEMLHFAEVKTDIGIDTVEQ